MFRLYINFAYFFISYIRTYVRPYVRFYSKLKKENEPPVRIGHELLNKNFVFASLQLIFIKYSRPRLAVVPFSSLSLRNTHDMLRLSILKNTSYFSSWLIKTIWQKSNYFNEPPVRIELTTYGLRYHCSTNWAKVAFMLNYIVASLTNLKPLLFHPFPISLSLDIGNFFFLKNRIKNKAVCFLSTELPRL